MRVPLGFDQHSEYETQRRGPFTQTPARPPRVGFKHINQIRLLHLVSLLGRDYADKHAIVSSLCANG